MFSPSRASLRRGIADNSIGAVAIIILLALALRLLFFVGMARTDDYHYAQAAYNLANGSYQVSGGSLHHQARLAIVLPVAASFHLLGVNEYAAELWPLVCSLGSIIVIFYLGKLLFGQRTGLVAALLLSFFPLEVLYSTQLLPDVIQPFLLAMSVLFFLKGQDANSSSASYTWSCLSWLTIGAAFFARESGVVIVLFHVAYILYNRTVRREYLMAAATMGALTVLAGLIYSRLQGDPLVGLRYIAQLIQLGTAEHLYGAARNLAEQWPEYIRVLVTGPYFVHFTILTIIAFVYLLRRREKHLYVPALWLLALLSYLEILSSIHYMRRLDRYLTILTIPSLLMVARFLSVFVTRGRKGLGPALSHASSAPLANRSKAYWLSTIVPYSRLFYWAAYGVAVCALLASMLFSPAFVRDRLSPDGILEAKTVWIIHQLRLVACCTGLLLTIAVLVSRTWGWLRILETPTRIFAGIVVSTLERFRRRDYRRVAVGLLVGFLFAQSVAYVAVAAPQWRRHTYRFREAGNFLASLPEKDIYLPAPSSPYQRHWLARVNFYLDYDTGYDLFGSEEDNSDSRLKPLPDTGLGRIEDAYVVTDQWTWEDERWVIAEEMPVPDWWQELMRITYARGHTVIYYTGKGGPYQAN